MAKEKQNKEIGNMEKILENFENLKDYQTVFDNIVSHEIGSGEREKTAKDYWEEGVLSKAIGNYPKVFDLACKKYKEKYGEDVSEEIRNKYEKSYKEVSNYDLIKFFGFKG